MTEKTASVHWQGQGKQGQGQISTETSALKAYPYGFGSRFEDDRRGTNPEELLGAAHAACFTMANWSTPRPRCAWPKGATVLSLTA